jgi:hypothetical protein
MTIRNEVLKRLGLAIVLFSFWNTFTLVYQILVGILIGILIISCIALSLKKRLTGPILGKFAEIANLDVTYSAFGFGLVLSGVRSLTGSFFWVGACEVLAGAAFIGMGIGESLSKLKKIK